AAARGRAQADLTRTVGTTWWQPEFVPGRARVIQIDNTMHHIGRTFPVDLGIWGDAADVVPRILEATSRTHRPEWAERVAQARRAWDAEVAQVPMGGGPLRPARVGGNPA